MLQSVWGKPERLGREQTKKTAAEVESNHSDFKHNLVEKEHFVIWKVSKKQPMFGKCGFRAVVFQKLTIRFDKYTNGETKNHPIKPRFIGKFSQKLGPIFCHAIRRSHEHWKDVENFWEAQTRGNFTQVRIVVVKHCQRQEELKKTALHLKTTLARLLFCDRA